MFKKSISGPIKNAVIIVPAPTMAASPESLPPEARYSALPRHTQTRSVMIRLYLNFPFFHVYAIIREMASYVETPRFAVMYKDEARHRIHYCK